MSKIVGKYIVKKDKLGRTYFLERKTNKRVSEETYTKYAKEYFKKRAEASKKAVSKRLRAKGKFLDKKTSFKALQYLEEFVTPEQRGGLTKKEFINKFDINTLKKALRKLDKLVDIPKLIVAESSIPITSSEITLHQIVALSKEAGGKCFFKGNETSYSGFISLVQADYSEEVDEMEGEGEKVYKVFVVISSDKDFNLFYEGNKENIYVGGTPKD